MAKTLKHRFKEEEAQKAWGFHNYCHWCGKNGWDTLHHIISPQSQHYREGSFNSSLLNSAPLHNHDCHLYNTQLHQPEIEKRLLKKTLVLLTLNGYRFIKKDHTFYRVYRDLYEDSGEGTSDQVPSPEPSSSSSLQFNPQNKEVLL